MMERLVSRLRTCRCENVLTNQTGGSSFCEWNYNGLGNEYQILAGPSFILAFSIGGLLIGALADRYNRQESSDVF